MKNLPRSDVLYSFTLIIGILILLGLPVRVAAQLDPPEWVSEQNVWHMTMSGIYPCDGCDAQTALYYSDMEAAGTSVTAWIDIRIHPDWHQRAQTLAQQAHSRGLRVMGALSNIWFWQEYQSTPCPDALDSSIVLDPYGIPRVYDSGWFQGDATWHSALDPAWEGYLLSCIQTYIDAGFDGLLIDEGAYTGEMYDFRPALLQEFNSYLAASRTSEQLTALAQSLGFSSFSEFDYAKVWRDHLPPGTTKLTDDLWYNRWAMNIPLWIEFDAFRRQRTHEVMARLFSNAKAYARDVYGRELPVSFNLSNIDKQSVAFLDLIDYVDLEFSYSTTDDWNDAPAYFPSARTTAIVKLLLGLGIPGKVLTNLTARAEIVAHGLKNTGLYRTLIADAYASGATFYVEERGHYISTDFPSICPWYRFIADHPELFNGMSPTLINVAILQLWEQYEWHPKRALNGAAALLADEGWQFDVLFSGEDVYPEFPGINRLLALTKLQQYPVAIIPTLEYCWACNPNLGITENHARLLLDYLDSGGRLVVFADDNTVDNFLAWNPSPTATSFYQRLKSAPANSSDGNIIRIRDPWPVTYFQTQSATLRESLSTILEGAGVTHHLRLSGPRRAIAAFAHANADRMVIHLVNYDYDRASDQTTPVNDLVLSLDGLPSNTTVITQTPDTPSGIGLPVQFSGGIATVTVPKIEPWTVLSISTYSISPTSQSFPSSGGTGNVNVAAPSSSAWTAISNASWITIISGNSGTGNGTVYYSVSANTSTSQRTGTMTIATQTFIIAQAGVSSYLDYVDTVQKVYIGYYKRPADPGGLLYWAERLDATGGNLTEIIEAFANSAESQALYGTITSSNISNVVNSIYKALFGRDAEAEGLNFYVNGFNLGQFTAATIMLNVLYGAQNEDLQSVNNKVTAANLFTRTIDPELDGMNFQVTYAGEGDATFGRTFLTSVTEDPTTVPTQDEITDYIRAFIADPDDILPPTALLRDDFDGSIVNASNWHIPTWVSPTDGTFVGQTQFRCSQNAPLPAASNGNAIIALDTYNPTGSSFYGTDLISNQSFMPVPGQGITVTVRAKMNAPIPAGIIFGIFLYAPPASTSNTLHDEIDFELLSNDPNHVWTNIYGNEPLGAGHAASHSYPTGSATDYHTYQIQWLLDQVSWYVDGTLVRTVTTQSPIPAGPMYVHQNIWVPGSDFSAAYDPNLHWTSLPSSNQTFSMSVDSVTVW